MGASFLQFMKQCFPRENLTNRWTEVICLNFLRDCGYSIPASGIQHAFQLVCPGKWFLKNALQWYKISTADAAGFGFFAFLFFLLA